MFSMAFDYFIYYGWRQYFWPVVLPAIGLFLAVISFNFIRYSRLRVRRPKATPVAVSDEAAAEVARYASGMIACRTVWRDDLTEEEAKPFLDLQNLIKNDYPNIFREMRRTLVDEYSIVYRWKGEGGRRPVLFLGHFDVLDAGEDSWSFAPFEGIAAEEFVYGRGALRCKGPMAAMMLAAERLIESEFVPACDIWFALLHAGESSTMAAERTAEWFKGQGITFEAVFDEGGRLDMDTDIVKSPVAFVCVSEKNRICVKLTAKARPGFPASPPSHTAIGLIAEAIGRLEYAKFPIRLSGVIRTAVRTLSPYMNPATRLVVSNRWLFGRLFKRRVGLDSELGAIFRTTAAVTMVSGGQAEDELPAEASAVVDLRLGADDGKNDIEAYFKALLRGINVSHEVIYEGEKPYTADTDARLYHALEAAIYDCFGSIPSVPFVQSESSNGRVFEGLCRNIYRFTPIPVSTDDVMRMRGQNERVRIKSLARAVEFYAMLYRYISSVRAAPDTAQKNEK